MGKPARARRRDRRRPHRVRAVAMSLMTAWLRGLIGFAMNDKQISELDPGIRDVVVRLNAEGFHTTDSGDGVSKPADWYESGEAIPFPHVVAVLSSSFTRQASAVDLCMEAGRMRDVCGPDWDVECSWSTEGRQWVLFASRRSAQSPPPLLQP